MEIFTPVSVVYNPLDWSYFTSNFLISGILELLRPDLKIADKPLQQKRNCDKEGTCTLYENTTDSDAQPGEQDQHTHSPAVNAVNLYKEIQFHNKQLFKLVRTNPNPPTDSDTPNRFWNNKLCLAARLLRQRQMRPHKQMDSRCKSGRGFTVALDLLIGCD